MPKKNKGSLLTTIKNLLSAYIHKLNDLSELASLEAQLAGQTFFTIIILLVAMFFLLISTWLSLLVFLFFVLMWLELSPLLAALLITLFNLVGCVILYFYMSSIKKNLFFPATRRQLLRLKKGL